MIDWSAQPPVAMNGKLWKVFACSANGDDERVSGSFRTPHAPFKTKHWLTHSACMTEWEREEGANWIDSSHSPFILLSFLNFLLIFLRISYKIDVQTIVRFTRVNSVLNYLLWPFLFQFEFELQNFKFCANNANCIFLFLTVFRDRVVPFALWHNIKWCCNSSIWSKQPARWAPLLFQFQ